MPDLREAIGAVRHDRRNRDVRCPAHDDQRSSLSVGPGKDGRVLLHCHAGCTLEAIVAAAGLTLADLFERRNCDGGPAHIVATYDYTDESGVLLYQVVRQHPKTFKQRRPDAHNGWVWKLGTVRRVLFGLPDLRKQKVVYIPEGEKDVLALRTLGLVATTNAGGASANPDKPKWRDEYTRQLLSAGVEFVVIFPDNDGPGRAHAEAVARSCQAADLKVKIVELPELPDRGDVSDWIAAGHTRDELVALTKATPRYEPLGDLVEVILEDFALAPVVAPQTLTDTIAVFRRWL